jgi:hypothetical protein
VPHWRHEIVVDVIDGATSRLSDTIQIGAGVITSLVAWFARREYARRHRMRKRLIETAPPA